MKTKPVLAWHFVGQKLRNGDPVPPDGETLVYKGDLIMCDSGLHASKRIIDGLRYAPGNTICRVRCGGEMVNGSDKLVCRERTILWRIDGNEVLHLFARKQALGVAHLWRMPEIVRQYLETGDESLRSAVWSAAAWAAGAAAAAAGAEAGSAARSAAAAAAGAVAAMDAANKQLSAFVMAAHRKEARK